jgi:protoheme IX farnesyltransferase
MTAAVRDESRLAALLRDYLELTKPRITTLVMMTAWCGFYLAALRAGESSLSWLMAHALLGIGLVAGGTAALNQVMEHRADALMLRTHRRPLPAGRMGVAHAAVYSTLMTVAGVAYLAATTNWLTAALALATSFTYLAAYTPLKKVSPVSTFIGAFPGAMPPVLGWAAVSGTVTWEALVLFGIVFLWQFPHFHSIAWVYREDYERAAIRMLPVVDESGRRTTREILGYSAALVPMSVAPVLLHMSGWVYFAGALGLSAAFLWFGWRLAQQHRAPADPRSKAAARHVLQASVIYLPLLFALMMWNA